MASPAIVSRYESVVSELWKLREAARSKHSAYEKDVDLSPSKSKERKSKEKLAKQAKKVISTDKKIKRRYSWATSNAQLEIDPDVTGTFPGLDNINWNGPAHGFRAVNSIETMPHTLFVDNVKGMVLVEVSPMPLLDAFADLLMISLGVFVPRSKVVSTEFGPEAGNLRKGIGAIDKQGIAEKIYSSLGDKPAREVIVKEFVRANRFDDMGSDAAEKYYGTKIAEAEEGKEAGDLSKESEARLRELGMILAGDVILNNRSRFPFLESESSADPASTLCAVASGKCMAAVNRFVPILEIVIEHEPEPEEDTSIKIGSGISNLMARAGISEDVRKAPEKPKKKAKPPTVIKKETQQQEYLALVKNLIDRLLGQQATSLSLFGAHPASKTELPEFKRVRDQIKEWSGYDIGERGSLAMQDGFLDVIEKADDLAISEKIFADWKKALVTFQSCQDDYLKETDAGASNNKSVEELIDVSFVSSIWNEFKSTYSMWKTRNITPQASGGGSVKKAFAMFQNGEK